LLLGLVEEPIQQDVRLLPHAGVVLTFIVTRGSGHVNTYSPRRLMFNSAIASVAVHRIAPWNPRRLMFNSAIASHRGQVAHAFGGQPATADVQFSHREGSTSLPAELPREARDG